VLTVDGTSVRQLYKSRKVIASLFASISILVIGSLLLYIQSLNHKMSSLEERFHTISAQMASYERAYCTNALSMTQVNTTTEHSLTSAGYQRSYQVHTPKHYDPSVRYPVVVSFDGIGGSGDHIEAYSGFNTLPVIAVYPDALPGKQGFTAWQGAPYSLDGDYDIEFIRDLLDALPSQYCIDATKLFAVGMSNGGGFAAIVGCRMSDQFRAVAGVSGAYYTSCNAQKRTASLLVVHGAEDKQVPLKGSRARKLPEVAEWVKEEALDRSCRREVAGVSYATATSYDWRDCRDDSILRLVVLQNQKHGWLTIPHGIEDDASNTTEYIWRFFEESMYAL